MPMIVSPFRVVIALELMPCCWYSGWDGVRRSAAGSVVYALALLLCSDDELADELLSSEMLDESSTKSLVGEMRPPTLPDTTAPACRGLSGDETGTLDRLIAFIKFLSCSQDNEVRSSSPFVVGGPLAGGG